MNRTAIASHRQLAALLVLALVLILAPYVTAAAEDTAMREPLGRLFFSPEERATLDRQRQSHGKEIRSLQAETLRLDGIVHRSSGKHTAWINGTAQTETESAKSGVGVIINPSTPGKVKLRSGDDAGTSMKVGEAVDQSTGERDTRLGTGSVVRQGGR